MVCCYISITMKNVCLGAACFTLFCLIIRPIYGQYAISNGVSVPARDTLRALIVFVSIQYEKGPCPRDLPDDFSDAWPRDNSGRRLPPLSAGDFFDTEIIGEPQGYITGYYHGASFGQYVILGDYLPDVVELPCNAIRSSNMGLDLVLASLDTLGKDSTLYSANGYALEDFDSWSASPAGLPKEKKKDGKIDLLYIIWRNNRFLNGYYTGNTSGYGLTEVRGRPFKNMKGVNNAASYNNADGDVHGFYITIAEHLHGIFGGNHWHSGGGRGTHTFITPPHNYGCTGQLVSTMFAPSGWDRWMMDWKNPQKTYLVSAWDSSGNEVNMELYQVENGLRSTTFILRDFHTTGDAVRIKLPHINYQKEGDIKNQYLWLEYRTLNNKFEQYMYEYEECADNDNGRWPHGTPGMYAYLQVGKDVKSGSNDINTTRPAHPNGLASYIFPLTAEGNFDFLFRYDRVHYGIPGCGSWGNRSLPIDKNGSRPNPFTGYNDLFVQADFNHDGNVYTGDTIQPGLSEMLGDSVWFNFASSGDWEDAFSLHNGYTELSMSTNPAPVPVYTYSVDYEFGKIYFSPRATYENRQIHLSGLSVELLEQDFIFRGSPSARIRIRWDAYEITRNVRWCGDIVLHPNDFDTTLPSLDLLAGKTILLDRGESPMYHKALGKDENGDWMFTDTTVLTVMPGAVLKLNKRAKLLLDKGSKLIVMPGGTLIMEKNSRMQMKNEASFVLLPGAIFDKHKKAKVKEK